jgi:hypothetical protein
VVYYESGWCRPPAQTAAPTNYLHTIAITITITITITISISFLTRDK